MEVRAIKRSSCGWYLAIVTVKIADTCPICGEKRGTPFNHNFHEDGDWYSCDRWNNPCGHIDKYDDVIGEAYALLVNEAEENRKTQPA